MPTGKKRALSGGRSDDYEYWHARGTGPEMNAPPWNPEGGMIALEVVDAMRSEYEPVIDRESQVFQLLFFGDKWARFKVALPRRIARDTRALIEKIFEHHACSLAMTRARTADSQ